MATLSVKKSNLIEFDINNLINNNLGLESSLNEEDLEFLKKTFKNIIIKFEKAYKKGEMPFMDLPFQKDNIKQYKKMFDMYRPKYENLVVLGIGGSALGTKAVFKALADMNHNNTEKARKNGFKLYILDNVDPEGVLAVLNELDLDKTLFNVISKSGTTAETMSQFMIIYNMLQKKLGAKALKEQLIATTDPEKGVLRKIVEEDSLVSLNVPPAIGGRFSVMTPVGLFPLTMAGLKVEKLLLGAAKAQEEFFNVKSKALWFAGLNWFLNTKKNKNILIFMPYADALAEVSAWFGQLWNESLGKTKIVNNEEVFVGQTAVSALGVTDQHSQLQLYMEGPLDKVICFLRLNNFRKDIKIPKVLANYKELNYLSGYNLSELINYEQKATETALTMANRPNMSFNIEQLNAETLGYLLHTLQLATVVAGELYGINPLNQPGVELGKNFTYGLMGRVSYEEFYEKYEKGNLKNKKYIF